MYSRAPGILIVPLLTTLLSLPACARSAPESPAPAAPNAAFAALQARGELAMGVDQYESTHRFDALADGGRIELQMNADDASGVARIREHLREITRVFQEGDFTTPAFVHMQEVPGAALMAARRAAISYRFRELPRGGEVRLTTSDPEAVRAIHDFMAFQRADHRAGGIEHPEHGAMDGMDHVGRGGMMRPGMGMDHAAMHGGGGEAAHDPAFAADMQLVHEMLTGHAAIERSVTHLPDGVRSVTESGNPQLAAIIKEHVASMMTRLASGEVFNVASRTIPVIFANRERITTLVEETERGVVFTQTTDAAELVPVLQAHAAEVDALVEEGMGAMMRSMMQRGGMTAAPGGARP